MSTRADASTRGGHPWLLGRDGILNYTLSRFSLKVATRSANENTGRKTRSGWAYLIYTNLREYRRARVANSDLEVKLSLLHGPPGKPGVLRPNRAAGLQAPQQMGRE